MTSPADIARALSEAERDALCGKFSFRSIVEQERGEDRLRELGLWKCGPFKRGDSTRTPLGDRVRQIVLRPTASDASTDRTPATVDGCGRKVEP